MAEALYFNRLTVQKEQKLLKAISLFQNWLDELMMSGISQLQHDPYKLDEIASRLVDFGAQGIARKLRLIPEKIAKQDNWVQFALQQIGEFYFVIRAFNRLHILSDAEKEDLLSYCGIPFTKIGFSEIAFYTDNWYYLGTVSEKEEKLIVRRNWFYGLNCTTCVLFLEFQFNRFVPIKQFKEGTIYKSPVQFYPSAVPQRIKDIQIEMNAPGAQTPLKSFTIDTALDFYSGQISVNPLLKQTCFILKNLKFTMHQDNWYVLSETKQMIRLSNSKAEIKNVLAYSSNSQNIFIGEYESNSIKLISVILDGQLVTLLND